MFDEDDLTDDDEGLIDGWDDWSDDTEYSAPIAGQSDAPFRSLFSIQWDNDDDEDSSDFDDEFDEDFEELSDEEFEYLGEFEDMEDEEFSMPDEYYDAMEDAEPEFADDEYFDAEGDDV